MEAALINGGRVYGETAKIFVRIGIATPIIKNKLPDSPNSETQNSPKNEAVNKSPKQEASSKTEMKTRGRRPKNKKK